MSIKAASWPRGVRLLAGLGMATVFAACSAMTSAPGAPIPSQDGRAVVTATLAPSSPVETSMPPGPAVTPEPSAAPATTAPSASAWAGPVVPVPILYHHRVLALPPGIATWTTPARKGFLETDTLPWALDAQLAWLEAHGYQTILPRDLTAHWDQGAPLPNRPVILTFDDGYAEWLTTLLPMLQRRQMVAELYITLDAISDGRLNWAGVRRLAEAGMGIGAHNVHHRQLTSLGAGRAPASVATMTYEVGEARRRLGAQLGTPPDSMAYVGGGFDNTLVAVVRKAGYASARSLLRGVVQTPANRWTLRVSRISIWDDVLDQNGCLLAPSETACAVDPALPTFARRVSGESPG